mgnify:CR=1 FL=1
MTPQPPIRLYGYPISGHVHRVRLFLALLGLIGRKAPLVSDRVPRDEARHHLRLRRVDDTDHVDVGAQAGTCQDVVDAGADRADRLQIGIALKCVVRRVPGHRQPDVGRRTLVRMADDFDAVGGAIERLHKMGK